MELKKIFDKACADSAELSGNAEINYACGLQAVFNAGLVHQKSKVVSLKPTDGLTVKEIETGLFCPTCENPLSRMHNKKIDGTVFYCEHCWYERNPTELHMGG